MTWGVECTKCYSNSYSINSTSNPSKISQCVLCSTPMPNCLTCSDSNTCHLCTNGGAPIQGTCVVCTVSFCDLCIFNPLVCDRCTLGYGLVLADQTCLSCADSNCFDCTQNYVNCVQCNFGYGLVNSNCQLCSVNHCVSCSTFDASNCFSCLSGYALLNTDCIMCVSPCISCVYSSTTQVCHNCSAGFGLNGYSSCQTCDTGCTECLGTDYTNCTQCDSLHYLVNSKCNLCSSSILNCVSCTNSTFCTVCNDITFLLLSNTC